MPEEDVEATITRISNYKGVLGCIVVSPEGQILKATCNNAVAELHAHLIPSLAALANNMIRDLDPKNELQFLRMKSLKHEVIVAPNIDGEYMQQLRDFLKWQGHAILSNSVLLPADAG